MCTYCQIADFFNKYIPDDPFDFPIKPLTPPWSPWTPYPAPLIHPWTREQLDEAVEILRLVKEMEDKLGGCPCEDESKMDFLNKIRERLNQAEKIYDDPANRDPDPVSD